MRALLSLAVFAACGGATKPTTEPPPPSTSSMLDCAIVADHVATAVDAATARAGITHAAVNDMVSVRCKTDGWSDETRHCMYAIKTVADGRACASSMTAEQRDAIKAHARSLRADASTSTASADDGGDDWIRHVVEE